MAHSEVEHDVPLVKAGSSLGADINYTNITMSDGTRLKLDTFKRDHALK